MEFDGRLLYFSLIMVKSIGGDEVEFDGRLLYFSTI